NVHVAGQHESLLRDHLLPALTIGAESDFDGMELGHFRLQDRFDKRNLHVRPWPHRSDGDTKALDHAFFIRPDDERALPDQKNQQAGEEEISEPPGGKEIPELLRLLEHVFKRVAFLTPWIFGIPNHAV